MMPFLFFPSYWGCKIWGMGYPHWTCCKEANSHRIESELNLKSGHHSLKGGLRRMSRCSQSSAWISLSSVPRFRIFISFIASYQKLWPPHFRTRPIALLLAAQERQSWKGCGLESLFLKDFLFYSFVHARREYQIPWNNPHGFYLPCGWWNLNPGLLQEQQKYS